MGLNSPSSRAHRAEECIDERKVIGVLRSGWVTRGELGCDAEWIGSGRGKSMRRCGCENRGNVEGMK